MTFDALWLATLIRPPSRTLGVAASGARLGTRPGLANSKAAKTRSLRVTISALSGASPHQESPALSGSASVCLTGSAEDQPET
jgi:hypothetical protein